MTDVGAGHNAGTDVGVGFSLSAGWCWPPRWLLSLSLSLSCPIVVLTLGVVVDAVQCGAVPRCSAPCCPVSCRAMPCCVHHAPRTAHCAKCNAGRGTCNVQLGPCEAYRLRATVACVSAAAHDRPPHVIRHARCRVPARQSRRFEAELVIRSCRTQRKRLATTMRVREARELAGTGFGPSWPVRSSPLPACLIGEARPRRFPDGGAAMASDRAIERGAPSIRHRYADDMRGAPTDTHSPRAGVAHLPVSHRPPPHR